MSAFQFAEPAWALLFLLVPPLAYFANRHTRQTGYFFSTLAPPPAPGIPPKKTLWRERLRHLDRALWILGLVLAIFALMRPQWGKTHTSQPEAGVAILLSIDTSRSMAALDFELNGERVDRLMVIKKVLSDFVAKRPHDEIGMVVFGEKAFTQCPLTTDKRIVKTLLDRLEIGMAGNGTAIGDGLALALKRLEHSQAKSKIVVLLTDGESNAGRMPPEQATELAHTLGIKVYTIGVGSKGPVPFPEDTPFGKRIAMRVLEIDEESLRAIAEKTGARYWNAQNTDKLASIYTEIDALEKSEVKVKTWEERDELYGYFLIPGLLSLILFPLVSLGLLRRWIQ